MPFERDNEAKRGAEGGGDLSDTPKYETCSVCGEMTGRAGRADDSIYTEDGVGPFCESCWASIQPDAAIKLQSELSAANARADALQAELERLEKRELNATIELCYDDGTNPFARETLKVADVGVADNVYVVKSDVVDALQRQVDAIKRYATTENCDVCPAHLTQHCANGGCLENVFKALAEARKVTP